MRLRYLVAGLMIALVAVGGATAAAQKGSLHATLAGKSETPKGDPDGSGTAEIKFTGTKVCWEIHVAKVGTIMAAHIHKGAPGVAGPVVVPFGAKFKSKGCTTAPADRRRDPEEPERVLRQRAQREVPRRSAARPAAQLAPAGCPASAPVAGHPAARCPEKRRLADSNRCTRLCRPLPNHSAKAPR